MSVQAIEGLVIAGERVDAAEGRTFEVVNPATATALALSSFVLRATRWTWLLRPIARVPWLPAFAATSVGFAANNLPGKVGEVLRPYLLSRSRRLPFSPLLAQLDVLLELRAKAKAAMIATAGWQSGWKILRTIPFLGPVRVAQILAIMRTPFRFRTKRNLWPYAGLAVVTRSSADEELHEGKVRRKRRAPLTRGLNRNHNPILKDVFKGAATAATARPGPLRDYYDASVARGVKEDLAAVTLARKIAAIALRLWKKGELWDPTKVTMQAT